MKDFVYYTPTEVVFGENSEEQIGKLTRRYGGTKVLVHYGGLKPLHAEDMKAIYEMAK